MMLKWGCYTCLILNALTTTFHLLIVMNWKSYMGYYDSHSPTLERTWEMSLLVFWTFWRSHTVEICEMQAVKRKEINSFQTKRSTNIFQIRHQVLHSSIQHKPNYGQLYLAFFYSARLYLQLVGFEPSTLITLVNKKFVYQVSYA